jgi:YgiT-type zinc finger domain-containing protein
MNDMEQDFCEYCHGLLADTEKLVTVYRHHRDRHYIFEAVPARVCPRCGERYFSAIVVREMDRLMQAPEPQVRVVPVPVIAFTPA